MIIDDSASVRQVLKGILETDPEIQVIGVAQDPYVAVERIKREVPDVMTLDIEMPRMDGLTFLERIMSQYPIPVVICSTLTGNGSDTALAALEKGAVDIITEPKFGEREFLEKARVRICDVVKPAARARLRGQLARGGVIRPKLTADAVIDAPTSRALLQSTETVVAVGASTGGTEALREFLEAMPLDAPGIVIAQHMPEAFAARFAQRLDTSCRITVKEAADDDSVIRGQALIAPGNRHLLLKRRGARCYVEVKDGPLVSRLRPAVDVLFRSAARYGGRNVIGVIMTGMGDDGARGMLELKQAGAFNIAQDEATLVVFGMQAEAIKTGAVDRILPLHDMTGEVVRVCHRN
nr:chemotaxis response regulator protein-glutamate methylesterase [uncultured Paludibaculum sp.]